MFLARIDAYDRKGPALRAVITVNPKALETARAMDAERKTKGPRSPLHGIPIVLKDNIDTADHADHRRLGAARRLDSAGRCVRREEAARRRRGDHREGEPVGVRVRRGAQLARRPDPQSARSRRGSPSGSSGGTGASIAAAFAMAGLGTDTGGSVRGPSTANGIAGLKTTMGLVSRDGVIPLALELRHRRSDGEERLRRRRDVERDRRRRSRRCRRPKRARAEASPTTRSR